MKKGQIHRITERIYPKRRTGGNKRPTLLSDCFYNQQGQLLEERRLRRKHLCRTTYTYDRSGRLVEKNEYNSDHTPFFRYRYRYDRWGNQVEELCFSSNGDLTQSSTQRYNEQGEELERRLRRGERTDDVRYIYDEHGLLTHEERRSQGKVVCTYSYQYDDRGNKILEEIVTSDGTHIVHRQEYDYDDRGNIVDQKIYLPNQDQLYNHYTFQYNERGQSTFRCQYLSDGSFQGRIMMYDDEGRKTEEYWCNSQHLTCGAAQYRYQRDGQLVEEHHLVGNLALDYHRIFISALHDAMNPPAEVPHLPWLRDGRHSMHINGILTHQINYACTRLSLSYKQCYDYDDQGHCIALQVTHYDAQGTIVMQNQQHFDTEGHLVEEIQGDQRDLYHYDDRGNWIRKEHYEEGRLDEVHERTILYYD